MPLAPGTRFGPYEVTGPLGAGGMGEVYRARDTKLNRDVAIKVLPAALAQDADYLARFQREAQVLASLNHPHIAAIYGIEDHAIVMELVPGQTLTGQKLPLEEALKVAKQIAEALEAAHDKGIIHRDLKPGNIIVTPEGIAKVHDFGLATTATATNQTTTADSPTLTMRATQAGMILGTAGYMSPEQARGGAVDKRTDIWAFGVVLYELLSGRRLFHGDTISDTLAAVLKSDPDWSALPADTPAWVRRLLMRCLERDRKQRLRDIGDAFLEESMPVARRAGQSRWALPAVAAALIAGAAGGWSFRAPTPVELASTSFAIPVDGLEIGPSTGIHGVVPFSGRSFWRVPRRRSGGMRGGGRCPITGRRGLVRW